MKAAAVIPMKAGTLHFVDVPMPRISDNEVLVRVIRVGIDGTDKDIGMGYYGQAPKGSKYLIVGHESLGVVEKLGNRARGKGIAKGDIVVATVRRPDRCINCAAGESDMCLAGNYRERGIKGEHGYMAEYYKETPENLVKISKDVKDVAVMLEPFSIAEKAVMQPFEIQERMVWKPKTAVVLGTGSVGLFAAMLLRLRGLDVISVDRTSGNQIRNRIFRGMGIRHINSKRTAIQDIPKTIGRQVDLVVELTGNPKVVYSAIGILGINGVASLVSVTGGSYMMQVDMARLNYNLVLGNRVVVGVVNSNRRYFVQGVKDMMAIESKHRGLLSSMITKRIPFSRFDDYSVMEGQIKTVIEIGKE